MTSLLEARQYVKKFYMKYETIITYVWKFFLALICLGLINSELGYHSTLNNVLILLMASLLCTILPTNFIVFMSTLFILGHLYKLSIESAAAAFIVFILMYLLYFRFTPKDTLAVLLTPVLFAFHIPYLMPVALGLFSTPLSIVSMTCGIVVYYMLTYISGNATSFGGSDIQESAGQFQAIISDTIGNKQMLAMIVAFAITLAIVYFIRRASIDHSWEIAIIAGCLIEILCILVGELVFESQISFVGVIFGTLISGIILKAIQFFAFNLDYTRTENVQFEDDEYYYYVKAVPKVTVSTPERRVKKINRSQATKSQSTTRSTSSDRTMRDLDN